MISQRCKFFCQFFLPFFLLFFSMHAFAPFRVEVSGVGLTQVPISIAPFKGQSASGQKIGDIVQADLERSGQFRAVAANAGVLDEVSLPNLSVFRQAGSDALVSGSIGMLADGRMDVRFRLWDVVKGKDLGGQSFAVVPSDARLAAHRVSDYV